MQLPRGRGTSVLENIYRSFVSHLFEYSFEGSLQTDSDLPSRLCMDAREELFTNLRSALDVKDPSQALDGKNREKAEALERMYTWLSDESLFRSDQEASKVRNELLQKLEARYGWLKKVESTKDTSVNPPRPEEWSEQDLKRLFVHLVNFSYLELDMLYRQIYYPAIYHPLLNEKEITTLKDKVWAPLYLGNVGYAAQVGYSAEADTFHTANGIVADEDLVLGSVCRMAVGVGLQAIENQQSAQAPRELSVPEHRWIFCPDGGQRDDQGSSGLGMWRDKLHEEISPEAEKKCCAAVLFCSFPLAHVFKDYDPFKSSEDSKPGDVEAVKPPEESVAVAQAGKLFQLFYHVCRNYELSVLQDMELQRGKSAAYLLGHPQGAEGEQNPSSIKTILQSVRSESLKRLATKATKGNPIGGLVAVRPSKNPEEADLRICVPHLERNLYGALMNDGDIARHLGHGNSRREKKDALLDLLTQHLVGIPLKCPRPAEMRGETEDVTPVLYLVLHCSQHLQDEIKERFTAQLANDLKQTLRFFGAVYWRYFIGVRKWYYTEDHQPDITFQQGKIIRDACETVAAVIAKLICIGTREQVEKLEHISHIKSLIHLALRAMEQAESNPIGSLEEESCEKELIRLVHSIETDLPELRKALLGVSVYYYAAHNLEPEEEISQMGTVKDIADWQTWEPGGQNRTKRTFVKAFMQYDLNRLHGQQDTGVTVHVSDMHGRLQWHQNGAAFLTTIRFVGNKEEREEGRLKFTLTNSNAPDARERVQEVYWLSCPRYRIAGVTLHQDNLEAAFRERMQSSDARRNLIPALVKHLRAYSRPTPFPLLPHTAAGWKVEIYTSNGFWTEQGADLVRDLRESEHKQEQRLLAATEQERANIAGGMFHNLKHYFQGLKLDWENIGDYRLSDPQYSVKIAYSIDYRLQRANRFVLAVEDLVKPGIADDKEARETLAIIPFEALLLQTLNVSRAYRALQDGYARPATTKYLKIVHRMHQDISRYPINEPGGRRQIHTILSQRKPDSLWQQDNLNIENLQNWWCDTFGFSIGVVGDFETLTGRRDILIGVLEELLLNSLTGASELISELATSGKRIDDLPKPHIEIKAQKEGNQQRIYVRNLSNVELSEADIKISESKRHWGLYAVKLLMKRIKGDLRVEKSVKVTGFENMWQVTLCIHWPEGI